MTYLHQIDPIAFSLGPVAVHWYGIMYLFGFAAAWWLGNRRIAAGRLPGVNADAFSDLLFYSMIGVVLGGRIGYMLFYTPGLFLSNPAMLFRVWEGGMSFHGGLIGVLIASLWWSRKHRLHFFDTMDFVAPLVPLGLGFGRLGNFIGAELWGKTTDGSWGVVFPHSLPAELAALSPEALRTLHATGALDVYARHPSQLYQAALEGLVLFVVLWWLSRKERPRGFIAGCFALGYGLARFTDEFFRQPDAFLGYLWFHLTMGQLLSIPLIILGSGMIWWSLRRKNRLLALGQSAS